MLVVTNRTKQNIQCYSYERLFTSLDLYFEYIHYHIISSKLISNKYKNEIIDLIEKNNIKTIWFFRSYYDPGFYEKGNLITDINIMNLMAKKLNIIFSCSDLDYVSREKI